MGDHEGRGHIFITRPKFTHYLAYARRRGERKFSLIGKSRSQAKASRLLMEVMLQSRRAAEPYFRGLLCGDEGPGSYYEPTPLLEVRA